MSERPSWDEYFLDVCNVVSKRATCDRGKTACVIVKDKQILATGYVGSPVGLPHCDEAGHLLKKTVHEDGSVSTHCVRTIHSEQNAICQAAKKGIALDGATLYAKMMPCFTCAKMIVNAGIRRVIVERRYHADKDSEIVLRGAGVDLTILSEENTEYPNQ
jgi:dCMP deaminase